MPNSTVLFITALLLVLILPSNIKAGETKIPTQSTADTLVLDSEYIQSIDVYCGSKKPTTNDTQPRVINSTMGYKGFFCDYTSTKPKIDFTKKTLLYFPTEASGCKVRYIRTVKIIGNIVFYHVHIIQQGVCKVLIINRNEILIPKLKKDDIVKFKVTYSPKP